jgi:hypothetical protein
MGRRFYLWSQKSVKPLAWLRLVQRRTVWCPTWLGLFCASALVVVPMAWWCACGESFLSLTRRLPTEVLLVEGWIGRDGIRAAGQEFEKQGYRYIVATGGPTSISWSEDRSSYAEMAGRELMRLGIPEERIIVAPAREAKRQRTYEFAIAAWRALQATGIRPRALNVFTLGPHARRSRLVFAKVFGPVTEIGVVDWLPSGEASVPWWRSSERARDFLSETAGYAFEVVLNSGRSSNSPREWIR